MISFDFKVNKSFLQHSTHPITIPKSSVDYGIVKTMETALAEAIIVCPDSTKLKGKIYSGQAGYGPYYQIQMQGYASDSLYKIEKGIILQVQIQKTENKLLIFLTKERSDKTQKFTGYTTKNKETEKALIEGAVTRVNVNRFERDTAARDKCIKHYGTICTVCDFKFKDKYGAIGAEYIHVHHIIPISSIRESYVVDPVEDLRPVCPNCHVMLHRKFPPILIDDLRNIIKMKR